MRKSVLVLVAVVAGGLCAAPALLQDLGPRGPSPYEVVDGWLKPFADDGFAWGGNSGVFPESPDRSFVVQRGETRLPDPVPPVFAGFVGSIGINALREADRRTWQHCIFVVDGDGNLIAVWDQWDHLFEGSDGPGPHRVRISPYDPERRVWVVHETGHQIFVFSNDGSELLMTLGEKNVSGDDETHLGGPQDVAFLPDGRVLVADGLVNSRVIILDADGHYITATVCSAWLLGPTARSTWPTVTTTGSRSSTRRHGPRCGITRTLRRSGSGPGSVSRSTSSSAGMTPG